MKYIIMCGGEYEKWETPRHLTEIHGETIVARTIRLLRKAGVDDIAISSNDQRFEQFGVPVLSHYNDYYNIAYNACSGQWCSCFYPMDEPVCYIFGDVIFSPEAIRKIVDYETDDIMLFGSAPPFSPQYPKWYIEPFAFKVWDTDHLHRACEEVRRLDAEGRFFRKPIAWEVWAVIRGGDPNYFGGYSVINDYTCDIDYPGEIEQIRNRIPSPR